MHGVATCFRVHSRVKIGEFSQVSERILSVDFEISGVKLRILNSYAPTNSYSLNYKQSFYQDLTKYSVIDPDSKTVDTLMRLNLPAGVDIEISI